MRCNLFLATHPYHRSSLIFLFSSLSLSHSRNGTELNETELGGTELDGTELNGRNGTNSVPRGKRGKLKKMKKKYAEQVGDGLSHGGR